MEDQMAKINNVLKKCKKVELVLSALYIKESDLVNNRKIIHKGFSEKETINHMHSNII